MGSASRTGRSSPTRWPQAAKSACSRPCPAAEQPRRMEMSDRLYVATRKGLFTVVRKSGRWSMQEPAFLGDPVTAVLPDPRDGTLYAALNLGHFGVKMRRSKDAGRTWDEHAVPSYPSEPEGAPQDPPWKLVQVWTLELGGTDEPGVVWAGT